MTRTQLEEVVMTIAHTLGFPRMGPNRELKFALEAFWRGDTSESDLLAVGRRLREARWQAQRTAGLDYVTVGDFAWYDSVLEMLAHLGGLPTRFGFAPKTLSLTQYFVLARGNAKHRAMGLTKWFDTNYHYLVPEWSSETRFDGGVTWLFDEVKEARDLGHRVKVALPGPLTLLHLGTATSDVSSKLELLPCVLPAYQRLLSHLAALDVSWVQLEEPILGLDLDPDWVTAFPATYGALSSAGPKILLTTYFESVAEHATMLKDLPVAGLHIDLVRGPDQLAAFLDGYPSLKVLSLGIVDGRNIWRTDLDRAITILKRACDHLGDRLWVAPSCSLIHVPLDVEGERSRDREILPWLAFAVQKLEEIVTLKQGVTDGVEAIAPALARSREIAASRQGSSRVHLEHVRQRLDALSKSHAHRVSPAEIRRQKQRQRLKLPLMPTTTIGSFPQTSAIRNARAALKRRVISRHMYEDMMRAEIKDTVARQEALGLDVLVHGEPERNDMVEYFGEHLWGVLLTDHGWVQSFGSRCVKPPIIYGDVARQAPITIEWAQYAQSLTTKPLKGMLTGPITILQWSFVRDDLPRHTVAFQIALALRDEVLDLDKSGIAIIQIDEPALREGLPLKRCAREDYLRWAVQAFKLAASGAADETQIHTHMCYAEFNDILPAVRAMDADVITFESSRSDMRVLEGFAACRYPNEVGLGVYDIHSTRVPGIEEMVTLIEKAGHVFPYDRLWVNPDCGLKTRAWLETEAALANMVEAAKQMRIRAARETSPYPASVTVTDFP
jgi:5-methyltetrahydropteroyltriglutamate--homocysteine methyltransferase